MRVAMRLIALFILIAINLLHSQELLNEASSYSPEKVPNADSTQQRFPVDSLEFLILDAFDDVKIHSDAERWLYGLGNRLHIKTRESVVRNNLLFTVGDTIGEQEIIESERQLRRRNFISDASVVHRKDSLGKNIVRVQTSDHWTTTLAFSPKMPTGEGLHYSIGILESNFLGFGQTLGFFFSRDDQRDMRYVIYDNPQFIWPHHRLAASFSDNSDGFNHSFLFHKPYITRTRSQWSYQLEFGTIEEDRFVYMGKHASPSRQLLDSLPPGRTARQVKQNQATVLAAFDGVRQDSLRLEWGRSLHGFISLQTRITYDWRREGFGVGPRVILPIYEDAAGLLWSADSTLYGNYAARRESRPGVGLTFSRLRYAKLHNYRRVKWTEDVDRGWTYSFHVSRNLAWLGAPKEAWRFSQVLALAAGVGEEHQWTGDLRTVNWWDGRQIFDLYGKIRMDYQWKIHPKTSLVLQGLADSWWASNPQRQLLLGGLVGLNGFPTAYLAGRSRSLLEAEQRWFPGWEWGTIMPVFTVFWQAGGAWERPEDFNLAQLQQVAGLGLRAALTKSTLGVVNHVNLSWPLNGALENGWKGVRFSLLAKLSL